MKLTGQALLRFTDENGKYSEEFVEYQIVINSRLGKKTLQPFFPVDLQCEESGTCYSLCGLPPTGTYSPQVCRL